MLEKCSQSNVIKHSQSLTCSRLTKEKKKNWKMSEVRRSSRVRNQQKEIAETKPTKASKAKRAKKEELVDTEAFKKIVKKTKIPKSLLEETAPSDNESESGLTFNIEQIQ